LADQIPGVRDLRFIDFEGLGRTVSLEGELTKVIKFLPQGVADAPIAARYRDAVRQFVQACGAGQVSPAREAARQLTDLLTSAILYFDANERIRDVQDADSDDSLRVKIELAHGQAAGAFAVLLEALREVLYASADERSNQVSSVSAAAAVAFLRCCKSAEEKGVPPGIFAKLLGVSDPDRLLHDREYRLSHAMRYACDGVEGLRQGARSAVRGEVAE
jgi:hypothetical protein